ncbi:MAG: hypothetical protein CSYNP_00041 [Syntrophus sp. SKADARSKE-3]|nr:hypothetical protein [Syntrophus sp. SKADARSKE-3]
MITTVIPTFQRPLLLKRAIESALAQSFGDIQICVHDNASQDETESVVRDYARLDKRVFYFRNPVNIGPVRNMIQGVNAVETPYYSLLNDDDFLLPGFYEHAIGGFNRHPDAWISCAKTMTLNVIDGQFELRNRDWAAGFYRPSIEILNKMYSSHFVPTSVLFRRDVRDHLGAFEASGSDSLYLTIASAILPFVVVDYYGGAVTLHRQAYSMIGEGINKEGIGVLNEHLLESLGVVMRAAIDPDLKVNLLMLVINAYHQIYDSKRLGYLLGNHDEANIGNLFMLPSLITNRGLVAKFYRAVPDGFKPMVKILYEKTSLARQRRQTISNASWMPLPDDIKAGLERSDIDVSKIASLAGIK